MISYKNRGMLLEEVINKTIQSYYENNSAIIHKKNLDFKFKSINEKNKAKNAYISKKSTVDYYGIHKGVFLAFEAKSTDSKIIPKANFKQHQHEYLLKIIEHGGKGFYIILFKSENRFFMISANKISFKKTNFISMEFVIKNAIELELIYPGWIDFLEHISDLDYTRLK